MLLSLFFLPAVLSLVPDLTPSLSPSTFSPSTGPTNAPTESPTAYIPPCERNLTMTHITTMMASDPGSCLVIIRDYSNVSKVYEMRNYGHAHPHGASDISHFCGTDMTVAFESGPHNWIPFEGDRGTVGGVNRSTWFQCVGTFMASTLAPTPPTAPPQGVNVSVYPCLSLGKEYQIRQAVLNKFNTLPVSKLNAERAAFNGGLVRLAFHDAGTYSRISDDGGPDGCINLDDPDNAGLAIHMENMEELWLPFKDRISRADFWYLAAVTAIENAGGPKIKFRYGRKDCTEATRQKHNAQGRLPLANRNWFYVRGLFNYALGLSDREITALMGAHVLGRTHPKNSGFSGPWVSGPSPGMLFSNQFYLGLQTVEWVKTKNNFTGFEGREQWNQEGLESGDSQMFLTSDVVLMISNADDPACTSSLIDQTKPVDEAMPKDPQCIKNTDTYHIVNEYTHSQASFYRDFATAYQKLCELGYKEGDLIEPGTCFPGAIEFLNDPPVPTPAVPVEEKETIGGMPVGGFAVLIVVVLLALVGAAFWGRRWYQKRALQPLNETEAELIKQTTATKAKARSPSQGGKKDRKPTIVISTEPESASGQAAAVQATPTSAEPASIASAETLVDSASAETPVDLASAETPVDAEAPALPTALPKDVSFMDEPVS